MVLFPEEIYESYTVSSSQTRGSEQLEKLSQIRTPNNDNELNGGSAVEIGLVGKIDSIIVLMTVFQIYKTL